MIIVAGGTGQRMQSEIPKQFLEISGIPILMHTLRVFHEMDIDINIILVIPEAHIRTWKILCEEHAFKLPHHTAFGGNTRFQSVKNGLNHVQEGSLIAIHDGVRPLVSQEVIRNAFHIAGKFGTAVPAIPVNESMRIKENDGNKTLNRKLVRIIQTPQVFKYSIIKKAYQQTYHESFTDDAMVVEATGQKVRLTEGNIENIKITRKIDLKIAEALIG